MSDRSTFCWFESICHMSKKWKIIILQKHFWYHGITWTCSYPCSYPCCINSRSLIIWQQLLWGIVTSSMLGATKNISEEHSLELPKWNIIGLQLNDTSLINVKENNWMMPLSLQIHFATQIFLIRIQWYLMPKLEARDRLW